ncbi:MAG: class I SAM-dependent methyltransferase [Gaiellaceae bacterium]
MSRQNIYDDPDFFAGYRNLRENLVGLHENVVRPALPRLLPDDLAGRRVLDLGCGDGWFSRIALDAGAASVVGVDPSSLMLQLARASIRDPRASFVAAFAEDARFDPRSFDVIVSILALHYVEDFAAVIESAATWLVERGVFVFVIEHPVTTCQRDTERIDEGGQAAWPVRGYHDEGRRTEHWYVDGVVKYHRTVETTVNTLIDAGFVIEMLIEPAPTPEAVRLAEPGESGLIRPDVLGLRALSA